MPLQSLLETILNLSHHLQTKLAAAQTEHEVLQVKAAYLGKKGELSEILKGLGALGVEERPQVGAAANQFKEQVETACQAALRTLKAKKQSAQLAGERVDPTLPGLRYPRGSLHPITQVMAEVVGLLQKLGFVVQEGPEIETDYYNFEALNIPADHPARDMQDTFYLSGTSAHLLRTHTSPVQIHVMEAAEPPIQIIAPGAVYRRDSDVSHTPQFHQVEGLLVDRDVSFADLKGVLTLFLHEFFGPETALRFRPSYFPFTEPSAEVDISCMMCAGRKGDGAGSGCRVCGQTGWLEVLGCGMVHPQVFRAVHYDPEVWTGFAFGMGIERLTMLKYRINDIRLFYENDRRFLEQFS